MQLLDFARFLDLQTTAGGRTDPAPTFEEDGQTDASSGEEAWDALLAQSEAREAMRQMAREAIAEYRAGRTTEIGITDDGRLAPA